MRDVIKWGKSQRTRVAGFSVVVAIFTWMTLSLWQAERQYCRLLKEVRHGFSVQEEAWEAQHAQILRTLEGNLPRREPTPKLLRKEPLELRNVSEQVFEPIDLPSAR